MSRRPSIRVSVSSLLLGLAAVFFVVFFLTGIQRESSSPPKEVNAPEPPEPELSEPEPPHPVWKTSRLVGSPDPVSPFSVAPAFPDLEFLQPLDIAPIPDTQLFAVLGREGKLQTFSPNHPEQGAPVAIDLTENNPDLFQALSLAFYPKPKDHPYLYLCYMIEPEVEGGCRLIRYHIESLDPLKIDPHSRTLLIDWRSAGGGHNGSCLRFGPDNYLYVSIGDGMKANPPDELCTGQDISDLLSSILRIDVVHESQLEDGTVRPYSIPDDNPFVHLPEARPEVWAFGLRNPWRFCFDTDPKYLWTADVGWDSWEMIHRVTKGGNYGWSVKEGPIRCRLDVQPAHIPISPPVVSHPHTESRSIIGGQLYNGKHESLKGAYVYGDYLSGKIWSFRWDGNQAIEQHELANTNLNITGFGELPSGELAILDLGGKIHQLEANTQPQETSPFPTLLSQTGLFRSTKDLIPEEGVIPYQIIESAWADGATPDYWLAIPSADQIQDGVPNWVFPTGTVFVKNISYQGAKADEPRRLETQIIQITDASQSFRGYNYVWNEEQTDAELAPAKGQTISLSEDLTWQVVSRSECSLCHNPRTKVAIGFFPGQLSTEQRDQLIASGIFSEAVQEKLSSESTLVSSRESTGSLEHKTRSWFHANCAHCHRRGGGGISPIRLDWDLPVEETLLLEPPKQGTFDLSDASVISPGNPFDSVLLYRLVTQGSGHMPKVSSQKSDLHGIQLVEDWIVSLGDPEDKAAAPKLEYEKLPEQLSSPQLALAWRRKLDLLPEGKESEMIIQAASAHPDTLVRDLFYEHIPASLKDERLEASPEPEMILSLKGDPDNGRKHFIGKSGCSQCHQAKGLGVSFGPDLTDIASRNSPSGVLDSILHPSKEILPENVNWLIETQDGKFISGIIQSRDEKKIVVKTAPGMVEEIPMPEVKDTSPLAISGMPEQLYRNLTAPELADLLAFLMSAN